MLNFTLIKSKRHTIGIEVRSDGSVFVRAPLTFTRKKAEDFVLKKQAWIERAQNRMAERRATAEAAGKTITAEPFKEKELKELKKQAEKIIPPLVKSVAAELSVSYGAITIRAQKTRWGSCSSKGNLNFNCLLLLMPQNILRYVVVHELCHLKEMNHSKAFWHEVSKYQPDYKQDRRQLKNEGSTLLVRLRVS